MTDKENIVGKLAVCKRNSTSLSTSNNYLSSSAGDVGLVVAPQRPREAVCREGERHGPADVHRYSVVDILVAQKVLCVYYHNWYIVVDNTILCNKSFCISGPLTYEREFYASVIRLCGGQYKNAVSRDLSHFITNEKRLTTKRKAAIKNNTATITEGDLLRMIKADYTEALDHVLPQYVWR